MTEETSAKAGVPDWVDKWFDTAARALAIQHADADYPDVASPGVVHETQSGYGVSFNQVGYDIALPLTSPDAEAGAVVRKVTLSDANYLLKGHDRFVVHDIRSIDGHWCLIEWEHLLPHDSDDGTEPTLWIRMSEIDPRDPACARSIAAELAFSDHLIMAHYNEWQQQPISGSLRCIIRVAQTLEIERQVKLLLACNGMDHQAFRPQTDRAIQACVEMARSDGWRQK